MRSDSRDAREREEGSDGGGGSDGEGGFGVGVGGGGYGRERAGSAGIGSDLPLILFDHSHSPLRPLQSGWKHLQQRLRATARVQASKDDLTSDRLSGVRVLVFPGAREKLTNAETKAVGDFLSGGGSVLVLASEPTEQSAAAAEEAALLGSEEGASLQPDDYTLLNRLTTPYGITVQSDSLVRTVYKKEHFHPKDVFLDAPALLKSVDRLADARAQSAARARREKGDTTAAPIDDEQPPSKLQLVYPFGCTLTVNKPAVPILTSGQLCFPAQRALAAMVRPSSAAAARGDARPGLLAVVGSVQMLTDDHLQRADNALFADWLFSRLLAPDSANERESLDADAPEYRASVTSVPDTEALAERVRACLQESDELPLDFAALFDTALFQYNTSLIPEAVKLYARLNVKHEPLSLIPPQFEVPLPPLQPAVFLPCLRELPPPALDLFDLDEHFSTEKLRLAQLTNKCTDKDLEYYICDAGEILGIADAIRGGDRGGGGGGAGGGAAAAGAQGKYNANKVLEYILRKLIDWKKLDRDSGVNAGGPSSDGGYGAGGDAAAETSPLPLHQRAPAGGHLTQLSGAPTAEGGATGSLRKGKNVLGAVAERPTATDSNVLELED